MFLRPWKIIKKSKFLSKYYPNTEWEIKHLGNPLINDLKVISSGKKSFVIKKYGSFFSLIKWTILKSITFYATDYEVSSHARSVNEIKGLLWFKETGVKTPNVYEKVESTVIIDFIKGIPTDQYSQFNSRLFFKHFKEIGRIIANIHINGGVIGDCKAENILFNDDEYFFLDLEQFSQSEDTAKRIWDVTEFFFYLGHFYPFRNRFYFLKEIILNFLSSYFFTIKQSETISMEIIESLINELGKFKYVLIYLTFMNPLTFKFIMETINEFKNDFKSKMK